MRDPVRRAAAAALWLICVFASMGGALAQDIALQAVDGPLRIEGALIGYDGEFYQVETPFGRLTVDATAVTCDGFGCPELGTYVPELTIGGAETQELLPTLLIAYGRRQGWEAVREVTDDTRFTIVLRQVPEGPDRLRVTFDPTLGQADLVQGRAGALALRGEVDTDLRARVVGVDLALEEGWLSDHVGPIPPMSETCGRRVPVDRARVKAGDLRGVQPVSVVTRAGRYPREVRDWLAWVQSPAAANVVRRLGYADLTAEAIPLAAQGERLSNAIFAADVDVPLADIQGMLRTLEGAVRLTPTLRFEAGAVRPDTLSDSVLQRLARDAEAGLYDGQDLLFVAFSDAQGPAADNRRISQRRAETVRDLLFARAPLMDKEAVQVQALGFGEALPVGCDDDAEGRRINRRVEVWTRPTEAGQR